jgi:salicylate hydroxylase
VESPRRMKWTNSIPQAHNQITETGIMSKSSFPLHITIVGAGIAGLAAATSLAQNGHHVQVVDGLERLSEIGAGIQVTPNAMRILDSWGLKDTFYEEGTKLDGAQIRRYSNGKVLGKHRGSALALYHYQYVNLSLIQLVFVLTVS